MNFAVSNEDHQTIIAIAQRIERELPNHPDNRRTIIMDLTACHANGCALDLPGLLNATLMNFTHDVYGIRTHINRMTGKLEGFFVPRYLKGNEETDGGRTCIGNTPTCEDCGEPLDHCSCETEN